MNIRWISRLLLTVIFTLSTIIPVLATPVVKPAIVGDGVEKPPVTTPHLTAYVVASRGSVTPVEEVYVPPKQKPAPTPPKPEKKPTPYRVPVEAPKPQPKPQNPLITLEASAYIATCSEGCTGITATGIDVRHYTPKLIAVDPRIIPLNSHVEIYVDGVDWGTYLAGDTGGAIQGYKIDVLMATTQECMNFGRHMVQARIIQ